MKTHSLCKTRGPRRLKATAWATLLASSLFQYTTANASLLDITTVPLFLGGSVTPNVFFMLDNSGSMDWEILAGNHWSARSYDRYTINTSGNPEDSSGDNQVWVTNGQWHGVAIDAGGNARNYFYYIYNSPDNAYGSPCRTGYFTVGSCTQTTDDWRLYSAALNVLYYNPNATYQHWRGLPNADFTAARSHPVNNHTYKGSTGYNHTRNLTGFVYYVWNDGKGFSGTQPRRGTNINYTVGNNGMVDLWDNRTKYTVNAGSIDVENQSCAPDMSTGALNCTVQSTSTITDATQVADAKQNIANWYQYSRRRYLVAAGAVDKVTEAKPGFRYGMNQLNRSDQLFVEVPAAGVTDYTSHITSMITTMFNRYYAADSTPLRSSLKRAGEYYRHGLSGKADPIIYSCQHNFTILMSDGYWNQDPLGSIIGEQDSDTKADTLADVAWYYYNTDLSALPNEVRTRLKIPSPWTQANLNMNQHMVNYTVAFGIQGLLTDSDGDGWPNPSLADNSPTWWGNVPVDDADKPAKVDDMWHAAWNSRGAFYSAKNPTELVDGLRSALDDAEDQSGGGASGSYSSPFVKPTPGTSSRFLGRFDSTDWSGQLIASAVTGGTVGAIIWDTKATGSAFSNQSWSSRKIFSYNPVSHAGIPLAWGSLNGTQQLALQRNPGTLVDEGIAKGQARLEFLKGRGVNEPANLDNTWLTTNNFRARTTKLGDIVNSESFYMPGANVVFVGANDGMLHAFNAATGAELFAYVPSRVFNKLNRLTDPSYDHTWYVDGSLSIKNIGALKILVGTLRGGGQSVFALDVTDPASFDETKVLWEFSDSDDPDLGYVFGAPTITRMRDGTWAVLIGNGYNNSEADGHASTTGFASLYVLNVQTGALIKKFSTLVGSPATPNGLAAPASLDGNLDGRSDFIYAGDLQGKLWKFDVTAATSAQWNIPFGTVAAPQPLFTATSPTAVPQPITTRPQIDANPDFAGYLVYFGTGKYIEVNDRITSQGGMQTVYGVWDRYGIDNTAPSKDPNGLHPFNRSKLLQQSIIAQSSGRYVISDNKIVWHDDFDASGVPQSNPSGTPPTTHLGWFVDLDQTIGERVVVDSELRNLKLIVTTAIPQASNNPCDGEGTSNTLVLDSVSGSRRSDSVFDVNGDGKFDKNDFVTVTINGQPTKVPVSSVPSREGILSSPTIIENLATGDTYTEAVGSTGNVQIDQIAPDSAEYGRQSWRQLIQP